MTDKITHDIGSWLPRICKKSRARVSKKVDIAMAKALASELPDSYLRDTLRHVAIQFENDVRSDFPTIPILLDIEKQQSEAIETLKLLRERKRELTEGNRQLEEKRSRLRAEISNTEGYVENCISRLQHFLEVAERN